MLYLIQIIYGFPCEISMVNKVSFLWLGLVFTMHFIAKVTFIDGRISTVAKCHDNHDIYKGALASCL